MWNKKRINHCSFCGKSKEQAEQLIAGPDRVYICDQCIDLCNQIIQEERDRRQQTSNSPQE